MVMRMALRYQIIGRVYKGTEIVAYKQICSNGQQRDLDKEQLAYLQAKGQVDNVKGFMTKDDVGFKGIGINLNDLPTERLKSDSVIEKEEAAAKKPYTITLIGVLMEGRVLRGYYARSDDGRKGAFQKEKVLEMAEQGLVTNAIAVSRNGVRGLKGNGTNLATLKAYQKGDKLE